MNAIAEFRKDPVKCAAVRTWLSDPVWPMVKAVFFNAYAPRVAAEIQAPVRPMNEFSKEQIVLNTVHAAGAIHHIEILELLAKPLEDGKMKPLPPPWTQTKAPSKKKKDKP